MKPYIILRSKRHGRITHPAAEKTTPWRKLLLSISLGSSLMASLPGSAQSQWTTTDNFQLVPGFMSQGAGLGTNSSGDIIAVGGASTGVSGTELAVTRQSADLGQSWQTSTFSYPGASICRFGCLANYGQTLYVGGGDNAAGGTGSWLVARSEDGGATWEVSDSFMGGCIGIAADGFGNIFATGRTNSSGNDYLIVRKLAAGSSRWTTVYEAAAPGSYGRGIAFHPTAGVFVVGSTSQGSQSVWAVLKSPDAGQTWAMVDAYLPRRISNSNGCGIAVDPQGNVYATGNVGGDWVTRRSTDGGTSWSTIDTFQYFTKGSSRGTSVGFDYRGNVYVAGFSAAATQGTYGIVRELPAGGTAWQTTDVSQSTPSSILSADAGHVLLVTGYFLDSSTVSHWVTRRLVIP